MNSQEKKSKWLTLTELASFFSQINPEELNLLVSKNINLIDYPPSYNLINSWKPIARMYVKFMDIDLSYITDIEILKEMKQHNPTSYELLSTRRGSTWLRNQIKIIKWDIFKQK